MDTYATAIVLLYALGDIPLPEEAHWFCASSTEAALRNDGYVAQMINWERRIADVLKRYEGRPEERILGPLLESDPALRLLSARELAQLAEETIYSEVSSANAVTLLHDDLDEAHQSMHREVQRSPVNRREACLWCQGVTNKVASRSQSRGRPEASPLCTEDLDGSSLATAGHTRRVSRQVVKRKAAEANVWFPRAATIRPILFTKGNAL